jgi:hypothetical protein
MHQLVHIVFACAVGVLLMIAPAWPADLTPYQWKNRLLLVFSPTTSDPAFTAFNLTIARERREVEDRDLIVVRIFEKGPSRLDEQPLSQQDAERLRRRFEITSGRLTVILIGKDGGVKMVREGQAELQEIFALIDRMPMRQREMMEKGNAR